MNNTSATEDFKEHKADTRIGRVDKSAIAEHAHVTGHRIYWEPMVIEREQHGGRRKGKEALHIHRMKRRGGSMNHCWQLSKIWLDLVQWTSGEKKNRNRNSVEKLAWIRTKFTVFHFY